MSPRRIDLRDRDTLFAITGFICTLPLFAIVLGCMLGLGG